MSNIKRVKNIMDNGPLHQMFVLDAMDKHCDRIIDAKREDWPKNHIINFDSWQATAREIKESISAES